MQASKGDKEQLHDVSTTCVRVGQYLAEAGHFKEALLPFNKALSIIESIEGAVRQLVSQCTGTSSANRHLVMQPIGCGAYASSFNSLDLFQGSSKPADILKDMGRLAGAQVSKCNSSIALGFHHSPLCAT